MTIFFTILGLILLISFGGLMAASESAMGVLSTQDIRDQAQGRRSQRSLIAIANDLGPHRTVTTFVRILSETAAAVLVTLELVTLGLPYWAALLLAIFIMSVASFVLAGSSPRSVGRAHPLGVLSISAPIIHIFRLVLGPLANFLVTMGDKVTPGRPGTTSFASEDQLLSMVDEAVKHDVIESEERELIHSIFEWGDTVAREVMVPRIDMVTIDAEASLETATKLFLDSGYSRIPVIGDDVDEIIGVLNLRDVSRRSFEHPEGFDQLCARDLAREGLFVPESKKADDTLKQMQAQHTHIAFVVDEHGGIAGLVTLEDLIEELVGDIADEHDRGAPEIEQLSEHKFRVATRLPIDELGELFGLELDDEDVDSVGGLLAKELGRLPEVGDTVTVSGLIIQADRSGSHRKRVTRVIVEPDQNLIDALNVFTEEEQ
ncbi:hemolysin family protein [Aurantimicrobium minutum]|uniref:hemolysin family protein n=1 Tax=Aurantimicrobium minutum TaxID=708131 RepID=UPI00247306B3|nr:hemolysin family protein [Aurantimicrobium minutum]MDH6422669.1 CBS domain containing-hemolysin-like protein [Aurantimicrobium minutum]